MLQPKQREASVLKEALELIVKECAPKRVYLFGSRAKGKARPESDFDFAVEGLALSDTQRRKINALLDGIAGLYSVNLVFLSEVDEKFRSIILESGEILYDKLIF